MRVHHHVPLPVVSERLARPRGPRLPVAEVVPFFLSVGREQLEVLQPERHELTGAHNLCLPQIYLGGE